jgi:K(+)-stimulated pyrophosphate-energized sodium pump
MGASTQALFARVGGGIFTKAADVGADLVGKVEHSIPEDSPRNPATIADNVGDNVGDVAGMGADLYESYCGSILATAALGVAAFPERPMMQLAAIFLPMTIAAIGTILSIWGMYQVQTQEDSSQKSLLAALAKGINFATIAIVVASFAITFFLLPSHMGVAVSVIVGLVAGWLIGKWTEYSTSNEYTPTKELADQALTGPATIIIGGVAEGMISTWAPVLITGVATLLSFGFANNFDFKDPAAFALGLYGVGIAAVGMLATLGITLATDAYGPIADNAGGNAQMAGLPEFVRERTDALDALGNTTAATGKGFAIGSAALTALGLFAAFASATRLPAISLTDPYLIAGLFTGGMLPFLFAALTMEAVGRAAGAMVDEVRHQFRTIPGLMDATGEPDHARCVAISTSAALREMVIPGVMAVAVPLAVGFVLGKVALAGLLAGALVTGVLLAIFMANAGGAWDNAKKYVEGGQHGGTRSDVHKATVVGDTVGDPFKDTSGPSLNILIKLMSIVALVFGPLLG